MPTPTDTRGAAEYTGLAVSTLQKLRIFGGGPRYLKLGRAVRYRLEDLEGWLADRTVASTSQPLASFGPHDSASGELFRSDAAR
ncbi:MAG: transcriptional regulator [Alphaproteobacteria bacterium]|nr:transcriptional regulator [Alphaproteobacteria bacterium]